MTEREALNRLLEARVNLDKSYGTIMEALAKQIPERTRNNGYCPRCGQWVAMLVRYCSNCGQRIERE